MKKIVKASFVCFIIIISFGLSTNVFAAKKTIKGNAYSRIYKKGSIVFCVAKPGRLCDNLYRVDLNKLKARKIASNRDILRMQYSKGYLYYTEVDWEFNYYLYRVSIKTGKKQKIMTFNNRIDYIVTNKYIYCKLYDSDSKKTGMFIRTSKTGKNRKDLKNHQLNIILKDSNVKNYDIAIIDQKPIYDSSTGYSYLATADVYLQKPSGYKIFLTEYRYSF